jgi:hypothetical protein
MSKCLIYSTHGLQVASWHMMTALETAWTLHFGIQLRPCCSKANELSELSLEVDVVPELSGIRDKDATGKFGSPLIVYECWGVVVVRKEV